MLVKGATEGACCNSAYLSETHPNIKSYRISFAADLLLGSLIALYHYRPLCQISKRFDTTQIKVMDKRHYAIIDLKMGSLAIETPAKYEVDISHN